MPLHTMHVPCASCCVPGRTFNVALHECWVPDLLIISVAPGRLSNGDGEVSLHPLRRRLTVSHAARPAALQTQPVVSVTV